MSTLKSDDRRSELLANLADQVEALRASEGWQHWLETAAKFRTYSLHNQLLILAQRPDATRVAGYRTWQSLGRSVRRGEKGIAIFAPMLRRVTDDDEESKRVLRGFRVVHVFDIGQTEGDELADHELPAVSVPDETLWERLVDVARHHAITVRLVPEAEGDVRGWWAPDTREISLVETYPIASRTRTMLHELGHAFDQEPDPTQRSTRAERELVAESVAYLIGTGVFGIGMADASTFYVASWGADAKALEILANRVLAVCQRLEDAIAKVPLAA